MKKHFLLLLLGSLLTGAAFAATFSGTVTHVSSGAPLAGQKIYINDSLYTYVDTAVTDNSGNYSFTIPSSVPTSVRNSLSIRWTACGVGHDVTYPYTGSSLTYNFSICGAIYRLEGAVWRDTTYKAQAMVYVIGITAINSLTGDTTIAAIDSLLTDNYGMFGKYYNYFPTSYPGSIRIKAALLPSDPEFANYIPSYYNDSAYFTNSRPLTGKYITSHMPREEAYRPG